MARVFLASRNAKKLAELERILTPLVPGIEVVGLDDVPAYDEPVEDAPDFRGNALLKARAGVAATGLPSVADDSGLCVDALNAMPGVLSARWSGPPPDPALGRDQRNNELLLAQLADVPDERRGAHFACAVAFCLPASPGTVEQTEVVVEGRMEGHVLRSPRGENGFGYDPLFVPAETADEHGSGPTAAEQSPEQKDAVSHRGKALRKLAPIIARALND